MYIGLHVKYQLLLLDFNQTWNFSTDFRKILKYQISWKSRPVTAVVFHAADRTDGQTDMTRVISAFHNFCERAKKNHLKSKSAILCPTHSITRKRISVGEGRGRTKWTEGPHATRWPWPIRNRLRFHVNRAHGNYASVSPNTCTAYVDVHSIAVLLTRSDATNNIPAGAVKVTVFLKQPVLGTGCLLRLITFLLFFMPCGHELCCYC
jgi:hypothetical protein